MKVHLRILALLSCAAVLVVVNDGSGNGVNPPRLKETSTITASCHERSGTLQHAIFRARITHADESADVLTVRLGEASEQLAIADIESVALTDAAADRNGFVKANLIRRGDSKRESAAVQVRSKNSAIRLSGFNGSGSRINIDLAKCRRIEFSPAAAGEGKRLPPAKK
jgi:hypothetical protein